MVIVIDGKISTDGYVRIMLCTIASHPVKFPEDPSGKTKKLKWTDQIVILQYVMYMCIYIYIYTCVCVSGMY